MSERMNLRRRLIADLRAMGLSTDCELVLRPYSKTMWGYYDPNTDKLILYMYSDRQCKALIQYETLFKVFLHELVHSLQWKSSSWKRLAGVMHDAEFYAILNKLLEIAKKKGLVDNDRQEYVA